jgi:hypothetical protein
MAEIFCAVTEIARQLEAEPDRACQFLFIAALRSLGLQVVTEQLDPALNALTAARAKPRR